MSGRVIAVLQARMSSHRLPGKVLADLVGAPMLVRQIERIRRSRLIDELIVATSTDQNDDPLAAVVQASRIPLYRGAMDDVLGRFAAALEGRKSQHVVRLTGDCPLADPHVIDAVIAHHLVVGADITSNTVVPTFPDGLDVEVVRTKSLLDAASEAGLRLEREHVTQFFYHRPDRFRIANYALGEDLAHHRWTVDEPEDLDFVRSVYGALFATKPDFGFQDVLGLLRENPGLVAINSRFERNEGLRRSEAEEPTEN